MLQVGIVGCGCIGSALAEWIRLHNPLLPVVIKDPDKGFFDALDAVSVVFVSIPVETKADGCQEISALEEVLMGLPDVPVFIRPTILPGTTDMLAKKLRRRLYFMPEFLTERTAVADFSSQPLIVTGEIELMRTIFPGREIIQMTSLEAEIAKYAHNVFGALKVTFFNGIFSLCSDLGADYKRVRAAVLSSGYINRPHTDVPGPDGKCGYGGKCFPKDVEAFTHYLGESPFADLIKEVSTLNGVFRE